LLADVSAARRAAYERDCKSDLQITAGDPNNIAGVLIKQMVLSAIPEF